MKVPGICKDCLHRWQFGAKGKPQHLYCTRAGYSRIIRNHNMKSCDFYEKASLEHNKILRKRAITCKS